MNEKCHFIGIGGVGMSGLARLLLKRDIQVSGSDLFANYVVDKLAKEGAKICIGHDASHICEGMTVVYTSGIDSKNPEYAAALAYRCPLLHRSDMLCRLMEGYQALAVAGTHGKTTTSALLASVLVQAGSDPTFAIGGMLNAYSSNARKGNGPYFVAEACESDGTFTKYNPFGAIITNIDLDHMDFFGSEGQLIQCFKDFAAKVSRLDHLFWCGDDARLKSVMSGGVSYGFSKGCDLRVFNCRQTGWRFAFDCSFQGKVYENIAVPLTGKHNVLNAAAVFGLCLTLGLFEDSIRQGLAAFQGVSRRCEIKGEASNILVLDDYAHHPTEIFTTLEGIRKAVGERRLIAIFQPHRFTRTQDCLGKFQGVFGSADEVVVTDIYAAQEAPIAGVDANAIVKEIGEHYGADARYVAREKLLGYIASHARPHDVVVTLGAGDITGVGAQLLQLWREQPPRKWRVGVVFGGKSMEHEVSLMSAKHVIDSLDTQLYDLSLFHIAKNGRWAQCDSFSEEQPNGIDPEKMLAENVLQSISQCDLFFPVLHGPYGEDGTLQGFFDTLGKAYVGCDHRSAALCMDKALTKKIAALHGIAVVPFLSFSEHEWREHKSVLRLRIQHDLRYPVFVKPLHLGSTVGVSKVESPDKLEAAVEAAFKLDTSLLVENGLVVRELEFAVLGNDQAETFPPGEILTHGRVYDYHGKYNSQDPIQAVSKADVSDSILELGMAWAKKAYQAMECKGMARVDFFLDSEGQLWLNEINPIPGFTKNSLYPQICAANGISGKKLVDRLIVLALQRKRQLQRSIENL